MPRPHDWPHASARTPARASHNASPISAVRRISLSLSFPPSLCAHAPSCNECLSGRSFQIWDDAANQRRCCCLSTNQPFPSSADGGVCAADGGVGRLASARRRLLSCNAACAADTWQPQQPLFSATSQSPPPDAAELVGEESSAPGHSGECPRIAPTPIIPS